jgi:3-oxoacyl-[acyl-carrier-protein] synthase III
LGPVYISGISYVHGASRSILELADPAIAELADPEHGLARYRVSDQDIWQLAGDACPGTLASTQTPPGLLLYVSEHDRQSRHSLPRLVSQLGLPGLAYICLSGHGCGNLGPALMSARNMLHARAYEGVLLVLADRDTEDDRSHIRGLSVFSDGAVSCLLTREPAESATARFAVDAVTCVTDIDFGTTGPGPAAGNGHAILSMAALAAKSAAAVHLESGREIQDFDHIVFSNYRITTQRFLCSALGASMDQLLLGPIEEFAHCFSADVLVTLDMYAETGRIKPGERVLACVNGLWSLSLLSVECI